MLVYAGIDEAGYGPMLGPLCVAGTAFVLEGDLPERGAPNLWSMLSGAVCRRRRDRRHRIAVDDSKKLKGANSSTTVHPLRDLERGVLAFAAAADEDDAVITGPDAVLLDRLGVEVARRPWYDSTTATPVAHEADEIRIAASRVRRALERAGVTCASIRCEALDAGDFNQRVRRTGTKAGVNFEAVSRLVAAIWNRWPDAHPRVVVDRQGGRTHYLDDLQVAFPESRIRIVTESEALCRYELRRGDDPLTISFVRDSERHHLPVALASMTAKYVRELLMIRLNRFFRGHRPELKPTAGYVTDARRYLADIDPVIDQLGLEREELIRVV
ncbi:MAG: hypothetical protein GY715_05875 [Planctomycetes bacterium]|nr:hypothetical protein [Planctomycetota bacterium]